MNSNVIKRKLLKNIIIEFSQVEDSQYGQMIICGYVTLFVTKSQFDSIWSIYDNRNKERERERCNITNYIDSKLLVIAENLITILDEETFFIKKVLKHLYLYSPESVYENVDTYRYQIHFAPDTNGLKGKAKKQAENRFNHIIGLLVNAIEHLTNFAKIIEDEKNVNEYVANAIAWEAVRQKTISIYAKQWENEYAGFLKNQYDPDKDEIPDYDESKSEYIRTILECEDINFTEAKGRLIYYFVSKEPFEIYDIGKYFDECETLIRKVESEIKNDDIKNKLLIKQVRKPVHYTIDEIDLMSGRECALPEKTDKKRR